MGHSCAKKVCISHESNLQIIPVTKGVPSSCARWWNLWRGHFWANWAGGCSSRFCLGGWGAWEPLVHCFTCRWAVHLLIQCGDCPGIEIREAEEIRAQIWIGARRKTLQILEVHPVKSTWKCSSECLRFTRKLVHFGFPGKLELLLLVSYIALPCFSNAFSRNLAVFPRMALHGFRGSVDDVPTIRSHCAHNFDMEASIPATCIWQLFER